MAANTYKKVPKEEKVKEKKARKSTGRQEESRERFYNDRRFHLASGLFLMLVSFLMFVAFFSYLFTGNHDQSVVDSLFDDSMHESGREVKNWLGIMGAYVGNVFILHWFGLASFLFVPLLFQFGFKIVFQRYFIPMNIFLPFFFFTLLWFSSTMGYLVLKLEEDGFLSFLSGGIGFEMALWLDNLIGIGSPVVLFFLLLAFVIYYFNITNIALPQWAGMMNASDKKAVTAVAEEEEEESELVLNEVEVEEGLEDLEILEEDEEEEEEEEELGEEEEEETEEEILEEEELEEDILDLPVTPVNKTSLPADLSLVIEDAQPAEDNPFVEQKKEVFEFDPTLDLSSYKYPTLDLLTEYEIGKVQVSKEELEANKDRIVETLSNYKIGISSIKATIGPTVTLYEIVPDAGIRISKIKSLEDDIALNLAALGIRIIAPIPGKGTIGIEVPNKKKEMVSVRSVFSSEKFQKGEMDLPVVFGKTISNEIFAVDLSTLPHLLMAGATGQGKSVGINIIIASLLYKKHPSQLKFVMVDPKKVELSLYNKIERHFLAKLPDSTDAIITDSKKVVFTLNSLCIEMDQRYSLLTKASVRHLKEYNKKFVERKLNPNEGHRFLPYIVVIIDELADLMMQAGKEIETPIARLAQLARAIGIHLVVATQRPSVNVITGIIKANFPARLSFKVMSKIDSRTILDAGGADQLIGKGDMLFSHGSDLVRLQCAFIDTGEAERIVDFIGEQRGYSEAYNLPEYEGDESGQEANGDFSYSDRDGLFEEAARLVVMHQQGSTSLIQRKMKLGYNRAGRIMDQLEASGIVGPSNGSKVRDVMITDEMSLEQLLNRLSGKD
ncbi:MAG TPA: DNA translocase FtsK 4TM domain-containing protein [Cytophagaceae bacterium]|jgi:S-DNA-T family DNA segregation ATPase FtsK/SpoIIIE|nr:DNA translocase FtsK 4TM domain-containing protein [Cytophagaceae bacterium]